MHILTSTRANSLSRWRTYFLVIAFTLTGLITVAYASEHGASAWPLGVEGTLTALQPPPNGTMLQFYSTTYNAYELDDAHGNPAMPGFRLHVVAASVRLKHTWGMKFLGGQLGSEIAIPVLYENLAVPGASDDRFSLTNTLLTPFVLSYNKGMLHYYYAIDIQTPGSGYSEYNLVNIGQHYWSGAPVFGFTVLPNKGKTEISDRSMYYINDTNASTGYHSGNIFITEFSVSQSITPKLAIGIGGSFSKQTTDDTLHGVSYLDGYRSQDFKVGPTVRLPLGTKGALIFKYYRDTLVQNTTRGNAFWFQLGCPFPNLNRKAGGY